MKTAVVIPAFNEGSRIKHVLLKAGKYVDNVVVVDDGSTDNTFEISSGIARNIITLRHKVNLGKGAAMKTGCEAALKISADIIILMDADGQHKPEDIPRFIESIKNEKNDIVFGSRKIGKDMPLVMMLGNKFLSIVTSFLFTLRLNGTQLVIQ